jgi:hypothetical protein
VQSRIRIRTAKGSVQGAGRRYREVTSPVRRSLRWGLIVACWDAWGRPTAATSKQPLPNRKEERWESLLVHSMADLSATMQTSHFGEVASNVSRLTCEARLKVKGNSHLRKKGCGRDASIRRRRENSYDQVDRTDRGLILLHTLGSGVSKRATSQRVSSSEYVFASPINQYIARSKAPSIPVAPIPWFADFQIQTRTDNQKNQNPYLDLSSRRSHTCNAFVCLLLLQRCLHCL